MKAALAKRSQSKEGPVKMAPGYKTLSLIRIGGPEAVYDVWSIERKCRCIAKLLRKKYIRSPKAKRRLKAEAAILLSLSHPHIVRAYELLERAPMALIMETLPGETLSHMIRNRKHRLAARDIALLGMQICSALSYLHKKGYLHLDLKPSNIICNGGILRLIDFGLARLPGKYFKGLGTADYLSPEQAEGENLTTASDIFGLGAVLYETATGTPPFNSDSKRSYYEQTQKPAKPVGSFRRLPKALSKTIDQCLRPHPKKRPKLSSVICDLERVFRA